MPAHRDEWIPHGAQRSQPLAIEARRAEDSHSWNVRKMSSFSRSTSAYTSGSASSSNARLYTKERLTMSTRENARTMLQLL